MSAPAPVSKKDNPIFAISATDLKTCVVDEARLYECRKKYKTMMPVLCGQLYHTPDLALDMGTCEEERWSQPFMCDECRRRWEAL